MTDAEIEALAEALAPKVARLLRASEDRSMDAAYHASLPVEERIRLSKQRVAAARAAMKGKGKGSKETQKLHP